MVMWEAGRAAELGETSVTGPCCFADSLVQVTGLDEISCGAIDHWPLAQTPKRMFGSDNDVVRVVC